MTVIDCSVSECCFNQNCLCTAEFVRIDVDGDCLTFEEDESEPTGAEKGGNLWLQ